MGYYYHLVTKNQSWLLIICQKYIDAKLQSAIFDSIERFFEDSRNPNVICECILVQWTLSLATIKC